MDKYISAAIIKSHCNNILRIHYNMDDESIGNKANNAQHILLILFHFPNYRLVLIV